MFRRIISLGCSLLPAKDDRLLFRRSSSCSSRVLSTFAGRHQYMPLCARPLPRPRPRPYRFLHNDNGGGIMENSDPSWSHLSESEDDRLLFHRKEEAVKEMDSVAIRHPLSMSGSCDKTPRSSRALPVLGSTWQTVLGSPWQANFFNRLFVEWRAAGVGLIKDQQQFIACRFFAICSMIELSIYKSHGLKLQISVQDIFNACSHLRADAIIEWIKINGFILEDDCPWIARKCEWKRPKGVIVYDMVERAYKITDPDEFRLALALTSSPIYVEMVSGEKLQAYTGGFFDGDKTGESHAVVLVALGLTPWGSPYWVIQNSWGVLWGIYGYFYVDMWKGLMIRKNGGIFNWFMGVQIKSNWSTRVVS